MAAKKKRTLQQDVAVIRAAIRWFHGMRPLTWTKQEHIHNPCVNMASDDAEMLARAVGRYLVARHKGRKWMSNVCDHGNLARNCLIRGVALDRAIDAAKEK